MIVVERLAQATHRSLPLVWTYLLLITVAELVTAFVSPQLGIVLHAILLLALPIHGAAETPSPERNLLLALTLAPLIRVLSLALPLARFPVLAWYPIVAIPLFLASWMVVRRLGLTRSELGLSSRRPVVQMLIVLSGVVVGVLEYRLLAPAPLLSTFSWTSLVLGAAILIVFTGFVEELIFRGVLLPVASSAMGRWALVYVSLLFAVLHLGYRSFTHFALVFGVGLFFGVLVRWSGSIVGVTFGHGLANVMLFIIMPYAVQQPSAILEAFFPAEVWTRPATDQSPPTSLLVPIATPQPITNGAQGALLPAILVQPVVGGAASTIATPVASNQAAVGTPDSSTGVAPAPAVPAEMAPSTTVAMPTATPLPSAPVVSASTAPSEHSPPAPTPNCVGPPSTSTYVVVDGDTLWDIASRIYGDSTQYLLIYEANRERIASPDRISPGDQLVVPAVPTSTESGCSGD